MKFISPFILLTFFLTTVLAVTPPFIGVPYTGYRPSDGSIASSPNRVLICANGACGLFDKEGNQLDQSGAIAFHGKAHVFDPRTNWDPFEEKLIIVQVSTAVPATSAMVIATSLSADPNNFDANNWSHISIQINELFATEDEHWADFPIVGLDEYNLYIKYNGFGGNYVGPFLLTIPKENLYLNRRLTPSEYHYQLLSFSIGRIAFSTLINNELNRDVYMLNPNTNRINMSKLNNRPSGQPTVETFNIISNTISFANNGVEQKGTSQLVGSGPYHFANAYYKDDYIYACSSVFDSNLNERVLPCYKINPETRQLTENIINKGVSGNSWFFPALAIDTSNNIGLLAYSSNPNQYISATHIVLDEDLDVIENSFIAIEGQHFYTNSRYGDYSAMAIDPDGKNMWAFSQIPAGNTNWNAWATNICPSCNDPVECDQGYVGNDCEDCDINYFKQDSLCLECPDCNLDGICSSSGICLCQVGHAGNNCQICCPNFYGEECESCPDCGENATCDDGKNSSGDCICHDNYEKNEEGECVEQEEDCVNGELNADNECECEEGWDINPETMVCDVCETNYYGLTCQECIDCGLQGTCDDTRTGNGECICNSNWTNDSSGRCTLCADGYFGEDCLDCQDCEPNGHCDNERCVCDLGWTGNFCNQCSPNFFPPNCEICNKCLGTSCDTTGCVCPSTQEGTMCQYCVRGDSNSCSGNGTCQSDRTCQCDDSYFGKFCSQRENQECDPPCGKNSVCSEGECNCFEGFIGNTCEDCVEGNLSLDCPFRQCNFPQGYNISPNVCQCISPYSGVDCLIELECN